MEIKQKLISILPPQLINRIRPFYYRLRYLTALVRKLAVHRFNPILFIGDTSICFNSADSAFFHYVNCTESTDFKRLRNMCRSIMDPLMQVRPNIMIDAGANYGVFTILLNKYYINATRSLCIEPDSRVFPFLYRNIVDAGFSNHCTPLNVMLGETDGPALFLENLAGSLDSRTAGIGTIEDYTEKHLECATIDTLAKHYLTDVTEKRLLLKIDVQGADIAVLRGARSLISEAPSALVLIELDPGVTPDWKTREVFDLFKAIGFNSIRNLGESNQVWSEAELMENLTDYANFEKLCDKLLIKASYTNLLLVKHSVASTLT